jgi:hypothetical protein
MLVVTGAANAAAASAPAATGAVTPAATTPTASTNTVTPFGCRASGARVGLLNATLLEPIVANKNTTPCADDSAASGEIKVPATSPLLTAGPIGAFTYSTGTPTESPGAAAVSDIQAVNIPSTSGTISIVGPVEAEADYTCQNDQLVAHAQSTLDVINVGGKNMTLPSPGAPDTISLGAGSFIALNQQITTANSITERVLQVHRAGLADIVVGEATVTQTKTDPCAGTSGGPANVLLCPVGATLDPASNLCVIYYNGTVIVVSKPFHGPSGGTVLALPVARKKYPNSPCVMGAGPNWALVATAVGGRVTGTPKSDRILALGARERIAGLAGNDCVDGTGGNQTIYEGNGNDRVYASAGKNRIGVGNGNDYINGRTGIDRITAGNGKDVVYGGKGPARIDVGLGTSHVYGGPATNRIYASNPRSRISCGSGKHNTAFLRSGAVAYAKAHGCQSIHLLH